MATGRLTDTAIAAVREASRLDQVVSEYVTLKRAGTGTMKGLCPFHDEKSPSFHVTPERGFWHCFGCGEGGDVIDFLQKIEHLDFIEALERLAERARVELTYEPGTGPAAGPDRAEVRAARARLLAVNTATAEFYAHQLLTPEAVTARRFLTDRGFDRDAATTFGCGYAPNGWNVLIKHLTGAGYTPAEMQAAGLTSESKSGPIDRFRGRLMFPIRDQSGDIIGFGARKLLPEDQDKGPKYLNTPETALYKKSRVLYGLDKARKAISAHRRVVVVEGYTDVMACHLSGETTAVATCGTAFGEDHIRVIRRLLGDDGSGGEVIYTFDGDAAGQKAALRAFAMDDHFQTRTSVAVAEDGKDPCEIRISHGPEGIAALLENRIPLFEFALKSTLATFDLTTPEGRANALTATAPVLASIKHPEMREGYIRHLSRWTGATPDIIRSAILTAAQAAPAPAAGAPGSQPGPAPTAESRPTPGSGPGPATGSSPGPGPTGPATGSAPDAASDPFERPDPQAAPRERDALKVFLHHPQHLTAARTDLRETDFTHPTHRAIWTALLATYDHTGPTTTPSEAWVREVLTHAPSPTVAAVITELAVDPHLGVEEVTDEVATYTVLALVRDACLRSIDRIERTIARPDLPGDQISDLFAQLTAAQTRADQTTQRLGDLALGTPAPASPVGPAADLPMTQP